MGVGVWEFGSVGVSFGTHYLMLLHLIGNFCLSWIHEASKRWNYEKSICEYPTSHGRERECYIGQIGVFVNIYTYIYVDARGNLKAIASTNNNKHKLQQTIIKNKNKKNKKKDEKQQER